MRILYFNLKTTSNLFIYSAKITKTVLPNIDKGAFVMYHYHS